MLALKVRPVFGLNRGPIALGFERGEFNISFARRSLPFGSVQQLCEDGRQCPCSRSASPTRKRKIGRDPNFPIPTSSKRMNDTRQVTVRAGLRRLADFFISPS